MNDDNEVRQADALVTQRRPYVRDRPSPRLG